MSDVADEPDDEIDGEGIQPAEPLNDDASSRAGLETKRKRIAREEREGLEFWRSVFASPVGRREMFALLRSAHTFEDRFACGPNGFPQPEATWFQAGEHAFGQRLYLTWSRNHRAEVLLMHDENDARFADPKKAKR